MKKLSTKLKMGIGAALVILVGGGVFLSKGNGKGGFLYREVPIKKGDIEITILSTGTVAPKNRLEIKAPVAGRIDQVLVKEGQLVRKGQVLAMMSSTERAAMLDAARAKGPEELAKWSELYLATPVLSPINGTLILRSVEPGQTFTTTEAIFVISDRLTVQAQVDETDISQIKLQSGASIALDAYPDQPMQAVVDQIAFDAKTVNNVTTYVVNVAPEKVPDFMRSGMTANVTFRIRSKKDILLVPNEAIKVRDGRTTINLKGNNGEPLSHDIQTGISDGKLTEVLDGLAEGDSVLIAKVQLGSAQKSGSNPFGQPKMPGSRGPRQ